MKLIDKLNYSNRNRKKDKEGRTPKLKYQANTGEKKVLL